VSEPICIDCGVTVRPDNLGSLRCSPWGSAAVCATCRAQYAHDVYLDLRMDKVLSDLRRASPPPGAKERTDG